MKKSLGFAFAIIFLFSIQFILTNHYFQFSEIWNENPIVTYDYPLHYHLIDISTEAITHSQMISNPKDFSGGYVLMTGISKYLYPSIFIVFFPGISQAWLFKLQIFIINFLLPLFLYLASRNFGLSKNLSLTTLGLAILLWNFSEIHEYNHYGLLYFFWFVSLWIFSVSYIFKHASTKNSVWLWLSVILLMATFALHEYFFILTLPILLLLLLYLCYQRKGRWKYLLLALICIIAVIFGAGFFLMVHGAPLKAYHQEADLYELLFGIQVYPLKIAVLLIGFFGLIFMPLPKKRLFLAAVFFLFILGYLSRGLPFILELHPQRFQMILEMLLLIPGAYFLSYIFRPKRWVFGIAVISMIIFYTMLTGFSFCTPLDLTLSTEPNRESLNLLEWLSANTNTSGRILLEGSGTLSGHIYGGHYFSLFPKILKREFSGNMAPYRNMELNSVSFSEGYLLNDGILAEDKIEQNIPIKNVSCSDIERYIDLLNTHWIVLWHPNSKEKFSSCAGFKRLAELGNFTVFQPVVLPTYFFLGNGSLINTEKGILVGTKSEKVVLKYNYLLKLRTEEGFAVYPVKMRLFNKFNISLIGVNSKGSGFTIPYTFDTKRRGILNSYVWLKLKKLFQPI